MNKLRRNRRIGVIVIILAVALGMAACSSHRDHSHGADIDKLMKRATKRLDLNVDQQSKLQVLLETGANFRQQMETRHGDFTSPLKENLAMAELNVEILNEQFDAFESDLSEFRKTMIVDYAEFHASLNDEQRSQIVEFVEKMEKRKGH